ncbi:hypothetical protein ACWIGM_04570 [Bosea sp. NPDC055332]
MPKSLLDRRLQHAAWGTQMVRKAVDGIGSLNVAEKRLVAAAKAGAVLDLAAEDAVRAGVIRALVCAERPDWPVAPEGVRFSGGRVEGRIHLADREIARPLWLIGCAIPSGIDISDARTRALNFQDAAIGDGEGGALFAQGVHIQGELVLDGARVNGEFCISDATITRQFSADRARFANAGGDALAASGMSCAGVSLDDVFVEGGVNLASATIAGQFSANRARFTNEGGDALMTKSMSCAGAFLNEAVVEGRFNIAGATMAGQFKAKRTRFINAGGDALVAHGLSCASAHFDNAVVEGLFNIASATITGQFNANGARFANAGGDAVMAQGMSCADAFLDDAVVEGCFNIVSATIAGQFNADRTRFTNAGGDAFAAQDMSCIDAFLDDAAFEGCFNIVSATISGELTASGTRFANANGIAIAANNARFGSVFMRLSNADDGSSGRTSVIGTMDLMLARIDYDLDIKGARLSAGHHAAIVGRGLRIAGTLFIESDAVIDGAAIFCESDLGRVRITNSRLCAAVPARARALDQNPLPAISTAPEEFSTLRWAYHTLDLSEAKIGQLILPATVDSRPIGIIDLSRAKVGTLTDFRTTWPAPIDRSAKCCEGRLRDAGGADADHLVLDGFEYEHLDNPDGCYGPRDGSAESIVAARKRWLMAQSRGDLFESFRPQPWRQLAKVLAAHGHEEEAREIAIERRVMQRLASDMPWFRRAVSSTLHFLADYGFNPWKTVAWSGMVILIFAALYGGAALAYCDGKPLCADERVFVRVLAADFVPAESDKAQAALTLYKNYPRFDPLLYSFDTFLPLLDAGSEKYWRVNSRTVLGKVLYYLTVLEQIVGALLVSLIVTGFTGLLTRDEK